MREIACLHPGLCTLDTCLLRLAPGAPQAEQLCANQDEKGAHTWGQSSQFNGFFAYNWSPFC